MNRNDPERGTGRTTLLAMQLILAAMESPGAVLPIKDHWPTRQGNEGLWRRVREMIEDLRLAEFNFIIKKEGFFMVFTKPRMLGTY